MVSVVRFNKEAIIHTTYELVRENGLGHVSARSVSQRMKSSTAPIYSCFNSVEELKREVMQMASNRLVEYSTKNYTDKVFLNMGVGIARFARDEKLFFRALFLEVNEFRDIALGFRTFLKHRIMQDSDFSDLSDKIRNGILQDMEIYAMGLSTGICLGTNPHTDDEYIINTLLRMGHAVVVSYLGKFDNPEDVKILI